MMTDAFVQALARFALRPRQLKIITSNDGSEIKVADGKFCVCIRQLLQTCLRNSALEHVRGSVFGAQEASHWIKL